MFLASGGHDKLVDGFWALSRGFLFSGNRPLHQVAAILHQCVPA